MNTSLRVATLPLAVIDVLKGDRVDLASCPFLKNSPVAHWEYGVVESIERESDDCVVIHYESNSTIAYPIGTVLSVLARKDVGCIQGDATNCYTKN